MVFAIIIYIMGLNERQKQAVEYLDGPLLVLAGPGTGKTQLLSEKVAYILQNTDTNAESILCLTYTDNGAKNMRERLKTVIGADAVKVNIGTYHAFGQDILAEYRNFAPDYDRRLDNAIDEVVQYKIIKEIQQKLPATDILRGDNIKDIVKIIGAAKAEQLTAEHLAIIAEQNIEDARVISESISPLLKNVVPRNFERSYEDAYLPIYEILKQYVEQVPVIKLDGNYAPKVERLVAELARSLDTAIHEAEQTHKIPTLTKWRDSHFEKDEDDNYRLKGLVANKKLASMARVMTSYEEYLKAHGLFDFNDMIEEALRVLRSDRGFKLTLEERYQYILLDEFQDTNPSQFAIVKELTDYEKPAVMAVGDDDQAICEFQGALSSNLRDFKDYYDAKVVELTENYRSTQEILDFATNIIKQADDRFKPGKCLTAHLPAPKRSQICRYEFVSSDAEYGFVADKIAELVESGVKQSEIAVICYKSKYLEAFLPFLKEKQEIKIAYEKRDNLFEDERIHQILSILKYSDETARGKNPTVQVMELLLYPCFGLPSLEVVKLATRARAERQPMLEAFSKTEDAAILTVVNFLMALVAKSYTEPVDVMIDYVLGLRELDGYRSPLLKYYTEALPGEQNAREYAMFTLFESVAALRAKLTSYCGGDERVLKIQDLSNMIDDYSTAEMALTAKSPYRDGDEAVQILTAHKSKGLEFEHVFVISVDNASWGKSKGNNTFLSLPKNLQQVHHTGTTDSERLRVLYVALTRPKTHLYITNAVRDFTGKARERLDYLHEHVDGDAVVSEFLPDKQVKVVTAEQVKAKRVENLRHFISRGVMTAPDMRAYYREKMADFKMSASALTKFVDIIYGGPEAFFYQYVLGIDEPVSENQAFGTLVHATLEAVTNKGLSDVEAVELYLAELDKTNIDSEAKDNLRELGVLSLTESLEKFGEIIRNGKAEVKFGSERIVVDGIVVTGKIDHIVVDEASKTIEVYDYKTGSYHDGKWTAHPSSYQQMLQLIFYKMLLNHSREYRDYKVTKGHILYVVKNKKDGEIYEKTYEYNAKDEAEFRRLLKVVHDNIVSLKYLDDPELFISPDKSRNMAAEREFIELLLAKSDEK